MPGSFAPPTKTRPAWTPKAEPLVRMEDADELRGALAKFRSGEWDDEAWTAFRLRRGIYGQLQPGVQMVRIKVPGGVLPYAWARTVAAAARKWAKGDIHVTTRQAFQIYHVPTDDTPDLLADLAAGAMTTREACGNTLRNFTACAFSGVCPQGAHRCRQGRSPVGRVVDPPPACSEHATQVQIDGLGMRRRLRAGRRYPRPWPDRHREERRKGLPRACRRRHRRPARGGGRSHRLRDRGAVAGPWSRRWCACTRNTPTG